MRRQHKSLIKRKRGKDKDDKEGETTFMTTTATAVREVYVVEGDRARDREKAEDKGKIEKRQAAANRSNKKRYLPHPFSLRQNPEKVII